MGAPSTQILSAWIKETLIEREWVPLRAIALAAAVAKLGRSDDEIVDFIDEKLQFIAENLRDDLAECAVDGRIEEFEIDNEVQPYIRRKGIRHQDLLDKLRSIDPFVFEEVCAKILTKLGADAYSTERTNDGGIDFIGIKMKVVPSALPMPHSSHGVVIGQAKRYKDGANISETRLREFVGSGLLRRHELASQYGLSPLAPTLYAFWTTSDLDPNARRFARRIGLWYMDGATLASYAEELGLRGYVMSL